MRAFQKAALTAALFVAHGAFAGPLAGGLQQLTAAWENGDPRLSEMLQYHLTARSGDPLVTVQLVEGVSLRQVLPEISALGFRLTAQSSINPRLIEGYLPLSVARAVGDLAGISSTHAVQRPIQHAGLVQSQAVALQKADLVLARGVDGTGIRVGALSDSFDLCGPPDCAATNAAMDVASGDLPPGIVVFQEPDVPGDTNAPIDEGRGMMQLVHDLAPGAQMAFATAFHGQVSFAENILRLRNEFHADVITDDVFYLDEPMYSDGVIAQAVDAAVADGAAYFSSAGNNGLEAWEDVYRPLSSAQAAALVASGAENVKLDQIPAAIRPKSFHNFRNHDGSAAITQRFTSAAFNQLGFQWDEPFLLGKVKTDFNVYVFDENGNWMDPFSAAFPGFYTTDNNVLSDEPFEFIVLPPFPGEVHGGRNQSDYQIVIGNVNGGPARHLKYVNGNGLGVSQRQNAPSTFGHSAARGARSVAATFYAIPNFPEDFSSPGPVTIYLDANGNRLQQPEVRFAPQITAADGVDTTFFPPFPGADIDGNGFPNFFGTSAAAPDAAGVAALMIQAAGGPGHISPERLYRLMEHTATHIPLPDDRSWAAAFAGPVVFTASGDWTRWSRYFGLALQPFTARTVRSVTFDTSAIGLNWSANPNRFNPGPMQGLTPADVTFSSTATTFTLNFAPGRFGRGDSIRFGMSVFSPIQGSTQEDPDRFRGMIVSVTMDDGKTYSGRVFAAEKEAVNRFTGFGLVNADAAVRSVQRHDD